MAGREKMMWVSVFTFHQFWQQSTLAVYTCMIFLFKMHKSLTTGRNLELRILVCEYLKNKNQALWNSFKVD